MMNLIGNLATPILKIAIIVIAMTVLSFLMPDRITGAFDEALQYFIGGVYSLQPFLNVPVLLDCIGFILSFTTGIGLFVFMFFIIKNT